MSWLLLSVLAVAALADGSVQINLQKSIDIIGGGYSVLNITNGVSQLSGNIVSGIVDIKIAPSNPNSNIKFDLFSFTMNDSSDIYYNVTNCYVSNIDQTASLYSQYRSCSFKKCSQDLITSYNGPFTYLFQSTYENNENNSFPATTFIFDNTMYPCQNGTYYPEVELLQTISTTIVPNYLFFDVLKISLLVIIEFLIVLCTWNIVLYRKLRSLKKKVAKHKERNQSRDLFNSLDEMKLSMLSGSHPPMRIRRARSTQQHEMVQQERPSPNREHQSEKGEFYMKSESQQYL